MKLFGTVSQGLANLNVHRPNLATTLGGYELTFRIDGQTVTPKPSHWLCVYSVAVHCTSGPRHETLLGVTYPSAPIRLQTDGDTRYVSWEFQLPLTAQQIATIEAKRNGGSLTFKLTLSGEGGPNESAERIDRVYDDLYAEVSQSDWASNLTEAKAMDILLLEVAMPFVEAPAMRRDVTVALKKAQQFFADGSYAECVGNCRKAMESLIASDGRSAEWQADSRKVPDGGRKNMPKDQREHAVEAALWEFLHLGPHVAGGEITRRDAKLAIALTASVLNYDLT